MPVHITTEDDRKKPEPPKEPAPEKGYKHGGKAAGGFKSEPKMKTTEPSVDEVKMKKGGHAKKMAMGGAPMMDPRMMPSRGRRGAMPMARPPMRPAARSAPVDPREAAAMLASRGAGRPMMKEGGKADMAQDKAMVKKAFKQHDKQEHKGGKGTDLKLKKGGMMAGGAMHMMPNGSMMPNAAMKDGGMAMVEKNGKMVPDFAADGKGKMKKGGMMGGGAMHAYKTGGVVQHYKDGGHAAMTCKDVGGFVSKKKLSSC